MIYLPTQLTIVLRIPHISFLTYSLNYVCTLYPIILFLLLRIRKTNFCDLFNLYNSYSVSEILVNRYLKIAKWIRLNTQKFPSVIIVPIHYFLPIPLAASGVGAKLPTSNPSPSLDVTVVISICIIKNLW